MRLKNKEDLKKKKEDSSGEKFVDKNKAFLVPKSYIDFKNKWLSEKNNEAATTRIRGWKREKDHDTKELKELKKKQHKHKKMYGNKLGKKLKSLKANIRRVSRRRSHLKDKTNKNS